MPMLIIISILLSDGWAHNQEHNIDKSGAPIIKIKQENEEKCETLPDETKKESNPKRIPIKSEKKRRSSKIDLTKRLSCKCGRTYSKSSSLRLHKKECGKEPGHSCNQCSYKTHRLSDLRGHIVRRHSHCTKRKLKK